MILNATSLTILSETNAQDQHHTLLMSRDLISFQRRCKRKSQFWPCRSITSKNKKTKEIVSSK